MLSVCNIPQHIVDDDNFRLFWDKYVPSWKLPTRRQLQHNLGRVQEIVKNSVKCELKHNKVCLIVDETTDANKNSVINVLARTLKCNGPSFSLLLCSKRLQKIDVENAVKVVTDSIRQFCIPPAQLLMLVTDGAATMVEAGRVLKTYFPHLLHVTCLLHACRLVAETIRNKYPAVDNLIAYTYKMFVKSPKCIGEFKKLCRGVPLPPQLIITRWGTWLDAVLYYHKYFTNVKPMILKLNSEQSEVVRECQQLFSDPDIKKEIDEIFTNYSEVGNAIYQLQNSQLSLLDSLHIIDDLQTALENLTDTVGVDVAETFCKILNTNPDLQKFRSIIENQECINDAKVYFKFANINSVDIERSFSKYTQTLSPFRRRLSESTLEALLMLQFYDSYNGAHMLSLLSSRY